ncbi:MAG: hypothetical protein J6T74_00390 [Clostridia bacterium]|jgi:hypothetical protein|nr:hypothetical protein [Clostridia bacterium]
MKNISYRTNYLKEENLDGFNEYDLGSMEFGNFDFGSVQYYMVKDVDVGRPDILSQRFYGTTNFWWFVCWFNGISDVWNDLRVGMVIKYPAFEKVREAIKLYSKEGK